MPDPQSTVTAGEVGGIIAGATAVLYAIGRGVGWLLNFKEGRENSRAAKLQAWHDELAAREAKIDAKIEQRLGTLEADNERMAERQNELLQLLDHWRIAYRIIAAELVQVAPHSAALIAATAILNEPLPVPHTREDDRAMNDIDEADAHPRD